MKKAKKVEIKETDEPEVAETTAEPKPAPIERTDNTPAIMTAEAMQRQANHANHSERVMHGKAVPKHA